MDIPNEILNALGGERFLAMTGVNNLVGYGNTLRMKIPRNMSKANRLWITLDGDDTYTMRFFRFKAGGIDKRTYVFKGEKTTEVYQASGVYFDQLREIFTRITGLYTHL